MYLLVISCWVSFFHDISTFVDFEMLKPSFYKNSTGNF